MKILINASKLKSISGLIQYIWQTIQIIRSDMENRIYREEKLSLNLRVRSIDPIPE